MKLLPKLIIIMLFVAIVPLLVSGYFSINISQKEVIKQIEELHLKSSKGISEYIEKYIGDIVNNLRLGVNYTRFEKLSDQEKVGALRILYNQFTPINILTLLDENGEGIVPSVYLENPQDYGGEIAKHYPVNLAELEQYAQMIPFHAALAAGAAMSPVYVSKRKGIPLVAIAVAFDVASREAKWVLAIELSLDEIEERISNFAVGNQGLAFLVDDQGKLICHPQRDRFIKREDMRGLRIIDEFLGLRTQGVRDFVDKQGIEMMGAFSLVSNLGWGVVVAEPLADAYVAARKMRNQNLFWVGISMVMAIIIGIFFAQSLTEPVKKFVRGALQIAKGNFDVKIKVQSKDEIAELAQTFNYMGDELKSAVDEIKRWNLELQDRVEERTRELKETQDQLLQAQKMAAVGELGAGVAHELNNPLGGVLGYVQLLLMDKKESDSEYTLLKTIERESIRCKEIVQNLLDLSQQEKGMGLANINLNRVLEGALAPAEKQLISQKILSIKKLDPDLPEVKGDPSQLQQVFMHIIDNARNAMPQGGVLTISTKNDDKKLVMVKISDTGKGIPKEHLDRIFEPFFTTKGDWQAKGLGLSVSHRIITEHKGKIKVTSEVGKGTELTITFPAVTKTQLV